MIYHSEGVIFKCVLLISPKQRQGEELDAPSSTLKGRGRGVTTDLANI